MSVAGPINFGNWSVGKVGGAIVSDKPTSDIEGSGHSDTEYYGGYLVCESVPSAAIVNAIAALPDLYEAARKALRWIDDGMPRDTRNVAADLEFAIRKSLVGNVP